MFIIVNIFWSMLPPLEVKVLDINSEFYGVKTSLLMENAGKAVAEFVTKNFPNKRNLLFFCGTGNNGGDGFVAARYLAKRYKISLVLLGGKNKIKTKIAKENFEKLKNYKIGIFELDKLSQDKLDHLIRDADIILDAMLGIGISGEPREPFRSIIEKVNSSKKTVISIDVPTGFGSKISIKPDVTITFHDIKEGINEKNSGKIIIADIGIPEKAVKFVGPGELVVYYPRPMETSHKGENGVVLVIGGGPYIGAPALSGLASLRVGVDLVYIATPKRAARAITSFSPLLIKPKRLARGIAKLVPNLIVKELKSDEEKLCPSDVDSILGLISKSDAVVIGPGLGRGESTEKAVIELVRICIKKDKAIVIDADAIEAVSGGFTFHHKCVVTPHVGEFYKLTRVRLTGNIEEKMNMVKKFAKRLNTTILLKGYIDIISDGTRVKLNDIHNPAMTVGGTGDVLAGIVGGLLAKKVMPFNAARIGAFVNGYAGNLAFRSRSYGLVATDIIEEIPSVLKKFLK